MSYLYQKFSSDQIKQICLDVIECKCNLTSDLLHANMDKDAFFYGISGMDSLDIVEAVMEIERQLNIELCDEKIESMYGFSLSRIIKEIEAEYIKQKHPARKAIGTGIPNNKYSGLRYNRQGTPYCRLLDEPCKMPQKPNNTNKVYCDFIGCKLYNNFQKLR